MAVRTRKRLGDILIEANVITQEQLMQALAKQKEIGKRLGETLIEMKLTDEMEIAEAIGQQMKLKIAKIREAKLAPEVIALLPENIVHLKYIRRNRWKDRHNGQSISLLQYTDKKD